MLRRQYQHMDNTSGVGVLDKAATVLGALEAGPLTLAGLVQATGLARPTAHRLATALDGVDIDELDLGPLGIINVLGSLFLHPATSMFEVIDALVDEARAQTPVVVVDVHAEATSEKIALSWHLDGRVALVFGSHTHVPTADATLRPKGTAYISDCGMTGPYNGVIGRVKEAVLKKMRMNVHEPFAVAEGIPLLAGP